MPINVAPKALDVLPEAAKKLMEDSGAAQAWEVIDQAGYKKLKDWQKMENFLEIDGDNFILGVPFSKINAEQRTVEGFATLDNIDKAGDILDADASKSAFKDWVGNIREMHQKKAVGRKISYAEKVYKDTDTGDTYNGIWLKARISKGAEDTWQKVLDGTLAGFSVGGAIQEKEREIHKDATGMEIPAWRVKKYRLGEVSVVDSPCNGLANIALVKMADGNLKYTDILDELEQEKDDSMEDLEKAVSGTHKSGPQASGGVDPRSQATGPKQANLGRPNIKGTKPMPGQPDQTQQMPAEDDDMPFIKKILQALQAWREEEAKDGDDHDIAFISTLIQQLKERVYAGDPGVHGDDKAVFGGDDDTQKFVKDDDGDTDADAGGTDMDNDDETTHPIVAYPAQHLAYARDHLRHAHKHLAKNGHMSMSDEAHHMMTKADMMYKSADAMQGLGPMPGITGGTAVKKWDFSDLTQFEKLNKEPYGQVEYADQGYQSDKKKRYPINTAEHVQAALGYIEHPDNAALYTPEHLAEIKGKIQSAAKKFGIATSKDTQKFDDILHNNTESDISEVVEKLADEQKGLLRKFANFLFNSKTAIAEEQVVKEEEAEMDKELLEQTINEAVESLNKSVDGKFDQVGESLTKVASALEKVATTDSLDELKKSLTDVVNALTERVVTLETTGAVQKSNDNAGEGEQLEKSDKTEKGFWASMIVPDFIQTQYREGR